jgi:hypothetical protein
MLVKLMLDAGTANSEMFVFDASYQIDSVTVQPLYEHGESISEDVVPLYRVRDGFLMLNNLRMSLRAMLIQDEGKRGQYMVISAERYKTNS